MSNAIIWKNVTKILVVRLRSIGDTVLATPALIALRRFLPDARIDVLLEDWVAPVLDGFETVDNVLRVSKDTRSRFQLARKLRREKYDVAFNLHGGTTATFLMRATGAPHRVGYKNYQYSFLYNHLLSSSAEFWQNEKTHSAEQQLALLGFVGVPVKDRPKTKLAVIPEALESIRSKIQEPGSGTGKIALFHPAAAFDTKQWASEKFARVAEFLFEKGYQPVAVAARSERSVLDEFRKCARGIPVRIFDDLSLPEITALAARAKIFIGNDSGIAHLAAAVDTPVVVIFGSSDRDNWRPWTNSPSVIVYEKMVCQPCAGYICAEFDQPKCILDIDVGKVIGAIGRILEKEQKNGGKEKNILPFFPKKE